MKNFLKRIWELMRSMASAPLLFLRMMLTLSYQARARQYAANFRDQAPTGALPAAHPENPLRTYFEQYREGHGIWKWAHYFDIYHRHFARYIGQPVKVLEIGIYSGGSLGMWRQYFGGQSHIYGVDIEAACKSYENEYTTVYIGDQADRGFWQQFKREVEGIDILIDDGGHLPHQQIATIEEMLPFLRPGSVYMCEDIHGHFNEFSAYLSGLIHMLNAAQLSSVAALQRETTGFQAATYSIHFYPYVVVIEKNAVPLRSLEAPKHGSIWQPFFDSNPLGAARL